MTLHDVADYLDRNSTTALRLAHAGELPAFSFADNWRVRRSDLEKWIEGLGKMWTRR